MLRPPSPIRVEAEKQTRRFRFERNRKKDLAKRRNLGRRSVNLSIGEMTRNQFERLLPGLPLKVWRQARVNLCDDSYDFWEDEPDYNDSYYESDYCKSMCEDSIESCELVITTTSQKKVQIVLPYLPDSIRQILEDEGYWYD